MGVKVEKTSVQSGFTRDEDPQKYFPGFQTSNADKFIRVSTDKCATSLDVIYDVDYSALASDDSDLNDVVKALGTFIPLIAQGDFVVGSIINAIKITQQTIESILNDVAVSIPFQASFLANPCEEDVRPQVFIVTLVASGSATTSDPSKASARYSAQLTLRGETKKAEGEVNWSVTPRIKRATADWSVRVDHFHYTKDPFFVVPALTVSAWADDEFLGTRACAINVATIIVTITVIPEKTWGKLPNEFRDYLKKQGVELKGEPPKEENPEDSKH